MKGQTDNTTMPTSSFELPPGWRWVKLGEACQEVYRYPTYYGIDYVDKGVPEIRGELIKQNGTLEKDLTKYRFISEQTSQRYPRTVLKEGDFVLSVRGSMGKVALISKELEGSNMTANLIRISPDPELVYSPFLKTVFLSEYFQRTLASLSPQTTIRTIRAPVLRSIPVPLPPLPEQRRIAARLQDALQEVEHSRTACEKQLEAVNVLPAAYLRQVFESEEAKKWVRKKLGEVCCINPPRPENFTRRPDAPTTFVPMAAVDEKTGTVGKPQTVPYSRLSKGYTYFEEGDVLFAKITPCMQNGKHVIASNLIDGIGFGTTEFHVLRPCNQVMPDWIWHFVRQPRFMHEATAYFTGAVGQQRVPEEFLAGYSIPLPPVAEQEHLSAKLLDLIRGVEGARMACEKQFDATDALRRAILTEAFRGKL